MRAVGYRKSSQATNTDRLWTKALWDGFPWDQVVAGARNGWVLFDDFVNMPNISADADQHKYASYVDTGNTIKQSATLEYGALEIATDGTDNDEAWIQAGGNAGGQAKINDPAASEARPDIVAFEARFKVGHIVTMNTFVGLAEPGLAAADTITDAGALADKDFFGFHIPEADPDGLDFTYRKEGQTAQVLVADAITVVADTWMKCGFLIDYRNGPSQTGRLYFNGKQHATKLTNANIAAATFPKDEVLAFLAGIKNATTAGRTLTMDWVRMGVLTT